MQSLNDYLTMGGYAAYIWPAYGVAALVLIAFAVDSWRRVKRAEAALRRLEATQPGRPAGRKASPSSGQPPNRRANQPTGRP